MKELNKKWQKLNHKNLVITSKFLITFASVLLFIAWLMFVNNNFYPKSQNSLTNKIMNTPIEIMIWPITLIILFIFILPIWVTSNHNLLLFFLILALIILLLNFIFLFDLNISFFWIYWLIIDIINFVVIIFSLFVILQKKIIQLFKD